MASALRILALAILVLLLLNPPIGAARHAQPIVALDVSRSWLRATDSAAWLRARTRALNAADSVLLVGHTVRFGVPPEAPTDTAALLLRAAERAQLAGRPLVLYTDGESSADTSQLRARFPAGSQLIADAIARLPDLAIAGFESPATGVAGDSFRVRVTIAAGDNPPATAVVALSVDGRVVVRQPLEPLGAYEQRQESIALTLPAGPARAELVAVIHASGDREPRNDSARRTIGRGEQLSALAVSTSPDVDFREAARVLRGSLSLPTLIRSRVAPQRWVDDRGLPVPEPRVRSELATSHVVLLHGDTAFFGSPRAVAGGALALVPFPMDESEWYLDGALRSPLSGSLGTIAFDSLAPVAADAAGDGIALLSARGPQRSREVASLTDSARRVIVVPIRGTARWALRGGVHADAFATLWGSMFSALAERPGRASISEPPVLPQSELLPRRPALETGAIGAANAIASRRPLRDHAWIYVLLALSLCAEWVLRRRVGLR